MAVGGVLGLIVLGVVNVVGGVLGDGTDEGSREVVVDDAARGDATVAGDDTTADVGSDAVAPGDVDDAAMDAVRDAADESDESAVAAGIGGGAGTGDDESAAGVGDGPRGPPTVDDPARVLIVGDSDAGTFGPYLQRLLRESNVVETELDYKVSSGLARPDFFDWHAELEAKVPVFDPDIVVVTFGGNDGQFLADRNGNSVVGQARPDADNSEWTAEYRDRVRRVVEYLTADPGRTVVWVGIPNHADPDVRFRMQVQDEAVKAELAEWPEVRFVDAWARFAGRSGGFAQFVIDPRDGQGKSVRAADGFHLNQVGAEILAIDIAGVVFAELRERGAAI